MKVDLHETVEIPTGIQLSMTGRVVKVQGKKAELTKALGGPGVLMKIENNAFVVTATKATKREKAKVYSAIAHLNNMLRGVQEPYKYKLKICSGHFPMTCAVTNNQFVIKNFLGEKVPRIVKLRAGASVKIDGQFVMIESADKELAGQTAANIELATLIRNRDLRIFQDGIYIVEKAGEPIEA